MHVMLFVFNMNVLFLFLFVMCLLVKSDLHYLINKLHLTGAEARPGLYKKEYTSYALYF